MRKLANDELQRLSVEEFKTEQKKSISIVLDNIRSLNNIGSIFRTADAFLIEKIYLCGISACPPHREIQKTALGATETVNWEYFENTAAALLQLKKENYTIALIEQTDEAILLNNFSPNKDSKIAVVFGHEVSGVDANLISLSDYCIEIPQYGMKHSLNVSVCAGIVIWDLFQKLS